MDKFTNAFFIFSGYFLETIWAGLVSVGAGLGATGLVTTNIVALAKYTYQLFNFNFWRFSIQ